MRFLFCLNFIVALLLNLSFSKIKLEPVETLNGEEIISVDSNYDSKNVRSIIRDSIYEVVEKNNLKINASKFRNLDIKFKNKEISLDLQRIVSLENHNDLRPVFGEITNDMNEIYVDITIFNKYKQKLSLLGIHKPADLLGIELSDKYYKSNYKVGAIVDTGSQIIFQTESNFYEDTRISINLEGGIEASIINDNYAVNLNPNEAIVSEKFLKSNNHKVGDSLKIIVSKNKTYIFKIYDVSNDINSDIMIKNEEAYKIMYKMVPNYLKGKYYIYILNDNVENINDEDNIYYEVISNNKHINTENKDRIESIEMFRIIIAIFLFLQLVAIIIKEFLVINNKKYKFQVFFLLGIGIRESLMNEILETKKENLTILLSIIAGIWIYFIVTLSPLKNILYFYSPFILGILSGIVLILLNILIKISSIFFVRNRNK
ncbi:Uncharacterised protein [Haploplasma axanthum]|uniref:Uncharacterized protein n=2 Tax=Haploplasma axanthum TaxID=29552 RepID=A0A449BDM5_HAPAX|nr:Uncharacterised protein [Haploplasma axanthum]